MIAPVRHEPDAVAERYARRGAVVDRYSLLRPEVWQMVHERQRAILQMLAARGLHEVSALKVAEVGCGAGGNLLELLRIGFSPEHLTGIELLQDRFEATRSVLPAGVTLLQGDASVARIEPRSLDIVMQSTVFTSLLDRAFQQQLADAMWSWLRPGGAVLWYDFTMNNPRNPDVRGVPLQRVKELFPHGRITARRVTLAPPLARAACRVHPALYGVLNLLPLLRTHVLAWVENPAT